MVVAGLVFIVGAGVVDAMQLDREEGAERSATRVAEYVADDLAEHLSQLVRSAATLGALDFENVVNQADCERATAPCRNGFLGSRRRS